MWYNIYMSIFKRYIEYLNDNSEGYWFKRKIYGWGWTPAKWQGWVVLLVWLVFFYFAVEKMDHEWLKNTAVIIIATGLLIYVCYKKGEKPKWQWGFGNNKNLQQ